MDIFPLPTPVNLLESHSHNDSLEHHSESEQLEGEGTSTSEQSTTPTSQPYVALRRNPTRDRHPPPRFQEYITYNARHHISEALTYHKLSKSHAAFLNQLSSNVEPRNFHEAAHSQVWKKLCKKSSRP
ncbi:hypothetical protein ACFX16_031125 [Malus domestica]